MTFNTIEIVTAVPDDMYGIRVVQKETWLATYPHKGLGISRQDIESRFAGDQTVEGRAQMEKRKQRLSDPNNYVLVAKSNGQVIGFCMSQHEGDHGRLGAIYLLPDYQGKGIGKKLMEEALEWLKNDGDIYVNVVSYNLQAIAFYERFGFVKTGKDVTDIVAILPSGKTLPEIEMVKAKSR